VKRALHGAASQAENLKPRKLQRKKQQRRLCQKVKQRPQLVMDIYNNNDNRQKPVASFPQQPG